MFGGNLDAESEDDKDDDEDDEVNNSSLYTCLQSDLMIAFFLKSDIEEQQTFEDVMNSSTKTAQT